MSAEIQESGKKKGSSKQKRMAVCVDSTPMANMNTLLIILSMFCTSLNKPQTAEISMPSNDKSVTEGQQSKAKVSQAITLLSEPDDKLYYYEGEPNYKDYTSLKGTSYKSDGLWAILLKKNAATVRQVDDLKQKKLELKISGDEFMKQLSEIRSGEDTPIVVIKVMDNASYANLIDTLNEMQICSIGKYVITDIAEADESLVKNFESKGELSQNIIE